jgi:hypothetical protein
VVLAEIHPGDTIGDLYDTQYAINDVVLKIMDPNAIVSSNRSRTYKSLVIAIGSREYEEEGMEKV